MNKKKEPTPEDLQRSYRDPAAGAIPPPIKHPPREASYRETIYKVAEKAWLFDGRVVTDLPKLHETSYGTYPSPLELDEIDPEILLMLVSEAILEKRIVLKKRVPVGGNFLLGERFSERYHQVLESKK